MDGSYPWRERFLLDTGGHIYRRVPVAKNSNQSQVGYINNYMWKEFPC